STAAEHQRQTPQDSFTGTCRQMLRVQHAKNPMFMRVVSSVTGPAPREGYVPFAASALAPCFSRNRTGYHQLAPILTSYHHKRLQLWTAPAKRLSEVKRGLRILSLLSTPRHLLVRRPWRLTGDLRPVYG